MYKSFFMPFMATLFITFSASAATVNVDFSKDGAVNENGRYDYEDVLKIYSYTPKNAVVQSDLGLGVDDMNLNSLINSLNDETEALSLNFAQEVYNLKLTFSNWDSANDQLTVEVQDLDSPLLRKDDASKELKVDKDGVLAIEGGLLHLLISVPKNIDSTKTALKSASWKTELSTVPLPAALPLYAAGMGVLGFLGWRKKRRSA